MTSSQQLHPDKVLPYDLQQVPLDRILPTTIKIRLWTTRTVQPHGPRLQLSESSTTGSILANAGCPSRRHSTGSSDPTPTSPDNVSETFYIARVGGQRIAASYSRQARVSPETAKARRSRPEQVGFSFQGLSQGAGLTPRARRTDPTSSTLSKPPTPRFPSPHTVGSRGQEPPFRITSKARLLSPLQPSSTHASHILNGRTTQRLSRHEL